MKVRLEGTEVLVTKIGDKVILEPTGDGAVPWALIDQTGDRLFMADGREQLEVPDVRVVFDR